jgi:hypothetical protein
VLIFAASGCGARTGADRSTVDPTIGTPTVYRAEVVAKRDGKLWASITEWVSPELGAWQERDSEGRTFTFDGNGRLSINDPEDSVPTIRQGSTEFIGPNATLSLATPVLRAYNSHEGDGAFPVEVVSPSGPMKVTVEVTDSTDSEVRFLVRFPNDSDVATIDAVRKTEADPSMFNVPLTDDAKISAEVAPGTSPRIVDVDGYWFGSTVSGRVALAGIESQYPRSEVDTENGEPEWSSIPDLYQVDYETAKDGARPWDDDHSGQLSVVSTPVDSPYSKAVLAIYDGNNTQGRPWQRQDVTLSDGDHATMIPIETMNESDGEYSGFAVVTPTTLVHITDSTFTVSEMKGLIEQSLVPVGG